MNLLPVLICALAPDSGTAQDVDEVRERLKNPAQVFVVFQELLQAGKYAKAHEWTLSPKTKGALSSEAFYFAMTSKEMSYEASKRMMSSLRVHRVDETARVIHLCSSEFGFQYQLRLTKFVNLWVLDITKDELEAFVRYFAGRAMAWYRLQVKRADGWHYAYPPDWTYAPLGRPCVCEK
jgi:hypothetical protein